jgi:preprotein translocase subunit SecA
VLEGADLKAQIDGMIVDVAGEYVSGATADGFPEEWDLDKLWRALKQLYPVSITIDDAVEEADGDRAHLTADLLDELVKADAQAAYERREQELGPEVMREVERRVVLSVLDRKWREHLYEMDYLREGVSLRGYGQRDPLIEYQREGYDMFTAMMDGIKEESVGSLFNLQVQVQQNPIVAEDGSSPVISLAPGGAAAAPAAPPAEAQAAPRQQQAAPQRQAAQQQAAQQQPVRQQPARQQSARQQGAPQQPAGQPARQNAVPAAAQQQGLPAGLAKGLARPQRSGQLSYSAPAEDGSGTAEHKTSGDFANVGRNAPCPCGSGKKFKQCHGDPRNRQ